MKKGRSSWRTRRIDMFLFVFESLANGQERKDLLGDFHASETLNGDEFRLFQ